jgi:hypothetical protein
MPILPLELLALRPHVARMSLILLECPQKTSGRMLILVRYGHRKVR